MTYALTFELALPVVDRLLLLQEELDTPLHQLGCDVRWTPGEALRLVVRAFDDIDDALIPRLRDAFSVIARADAPFGFATHGTRLLPSVETPRLVAVGTLGGAERLEAVKRRVDGACESLGLPDDPRPWTPMVKIGRLLTPGAPPRLQGVVNAWEQTPWGDTDAKEMVLIRTGIVRGEAVTRVVARFELGTGR